MYLPSGSIPYWFGLAAWAISAGAVIFAALELRRAPYSILGAAAWAAVLAALRLIEFPLHNDLALAGTVMGTGFAVVVLGPAAAAVALTAATAAHGVISLQIDPWALGANVLIHGVVAPRVVGWCYVAAKRSFPSQSAGYALAFLMGAAGAVLTGGLCWISSVAAGTALHLEPLERTFIASLTITAAEGALATWGYVFAISRTYSGDGRVAFSNPATSRPLLWGGLTALALACGAAPFVPPYSATGGGVYGPTPALARAAHLTWSGRAVAGGVTVGTAFLVSFIFYAAVAVTRRRNNKAGVERRPG